MKYHRIFRILAIAVVLSLLMIAIPAQPAQAAAITLNPISGLPGTMVTVTGSAFAINTPVYIFFSSTAVTSATTSAGGTLYAFFQVPTSATPGATTVFVTDSPTFGLGTILAQAPFTVISAVITLNHTSGHVGDQVSMTGTGFQASTPVSITFDGVQVATVTTDASGNFSGTTFNVPASAYGNHTVTATAGTRSDTETFTTTQSIGVTPTSGAAGANVTITGNGFRASMSMTITFAGAANGRI